MSVKVSPSVLSADFLALENDIKKLEKAGVDMLHLDVMDGIFVIHFFILSVLKIINILTQTNKSSIIKMVIYNG